MAGSWMNGCEGWTWAAVEPGMAGDTEMGLLRSWADTHGCTAPGRSTDVGSSSGTWPSMPRPLSSPLPDGSGVFLLPRRESVLPLLLQGRQGDTYS
ncbi:hypothetical protein EYF80_043608 [Liparis tanakae]|uniref:Uncharacterized protein n=1 Tax=Liparis tanakae TaxID=230148 RepID=A0A4Z2FY68_9TELE|nr:hypothetical protein EYF80_043608 [Liparis tanakae]